MDIEDRDSNRRRKRNDGDNENNSVDNNENEIKKIKTEEVGVANSTKTTTNSGEDSNLLQLINGKLIVLYISLSLIQSINNISYYLFYFSKANESNAASIVRDNNSRKHGANNSNVSGKYMFATLISLFNDINPSPHL